MNIFLGLGMGVVTIALSLYTVFFFSKRQRKRLTLGICAILSAGAIFDISGTLLMIIGSRRIPLTFHGILGYTALAGMLTETFLIWKHFIKHRDGSILPRLNIYTLIAYSWWVAAYFAGGFIAMFELRG